MRLDPLEWRPDTMFGGQRGMVGNVQYRYVTTDYGGPKYGLDNYPTIDDAKAAAQADHEAYILNALIELDPTVNSAHTDQPINRGTP